MHVAEQSKAKEVIPNLDEIHGFLASGLGPRWFVQVEHSGEVTQHGGHWLAWKNCHVTPKNPQLLIDDILSCHARHPQHMIRLHAQRSQPHTRMVYWVDLQNGKNGGNKADSGPGGRVLAFKRKTLGSIMLAGVVLASCLLLNTMLFTG
jgi:ribulose bisphosphate carboxylase small subunit